VGTDEALQHDELRAIARRAFAMAKECDDPSLRAAINLLGEVAANLAAKLPATPATPDEPQGSS
jgi:hypothetical protein